MLARCARLISVLVVLAASVLIPAAAQPAESARCPSGTTRAVIAGKQTCLKVGQRCKTGLDRTYHRYGFHCHNGRLTRRKPQPPPSPRQVVLDVAGPPKVVFDWTTDRCDDVDIPDLPARAFRDADGNVQLISTHYVGRRFIGPDIAHISHDCDVVMHSGLDPDPAAFDDHEWIASTWTADGRTVYALVHDEYRGYLRPARCPSRNYLKCWYNAITLTVSRDGGKRYAEQPRPNLVASIPYRYRPDEGPAGMFAPSNIVRNKKDGFLYAFAWMNVGGYRKFGTCLMRTKNVADPKSWRAWNGVQFDVTFVNPYAVNSPDPDAHLCAPVLVAPASVTYSSVAHQWIAVTRGNGGFYYRLSRDLINWTPPELFYSGELPWTYQCGDADPMLYPALIDPSSTSRNYETSDGLAYVYFTRFHYANCRQTLDRDLVRIPVSIRP